jgi:hypothetical protein
MDGFTSKGLIILPPIERYKRLFNTDRERFEEAVRLLPAVFESNYGIKLCFFNSNVIYGLQMPESMESINCLCRGDVNYLNAVAKDKGFHALVCDADEQFKHDEYIKLRENVQKKHPFGSDISDQQRIEIIEKREQTLARQIAQRFELIITFETGKNPRYGIRTKKGDRRILIEIDLLALTAKGFHSGEATNIISLMNRSWAYKKVNRWEAVKNEPNE